MSITLYSLSVHILLSTSEQQKQAVNTILTYYQVDKMNLILVAYVHIKQMWHKVSIHLGMCSGQQGPGAYA